jgi:hypothetical protein
VSREEPGHGWARAGAAACLLLCAFFVIFPLGWLAEVWPEFGRWLGWVFATAWAHAIGHGLIFALAGMLLLLVFPGLRTRAGLYYVLMSAAALLQESFQLLYKQRPPVFDDGRDLLTDLIGLTIAFLTVRHLSPRLKRPA